MLTILEIVRRENSESKPYVQRISYDTDDENATVATALLHINSEYQNLKDTDGNIVKLPIKWECSCMQKKCGACAMLVNSKPCLACNAKLKDNSIKGVVRVEPLKKFPIISDLIVDRSIMFDNLKTLNLWFKEQTKADETIGNIAYEASRCIQCGCCLEVCPNFYSGGEFFGMSSAVPVSRIISTLPESQKKEVFKLYKSHIYEGCGKSLSCRNICPVGIDIENLLVNSNAAAIWKRKKLKK